MATEITHVVTLGCSFTYCQALYDPPNEGWPKLVADKFGVPIVNLGVRGLGNDGIYRRTFEYYYKNLLTNSKPFFIVAMSQNTRLEQYHSVCNNEPVQNYQIIAYSDSESRSRISKPVYEQMDDVGILMSEVRKLIYWNSIVNLFKVNNIPYLTSDYFPDYTQTTNDYIIKNHLSLYANVNTDICRLKNFSEITTHYPKALDKAHHGKQAQVALAEFIYEQATSIYGEFKPVQGNFLSLKDYPSEYPLRTFENINQWYRKEMNLPYHYGLDV